jgi:hypothetical protein
LEICFDSAEKGEKTLKARRVSSILKVVSYLFVMLFFLWNVSIGKEATGDIKKNNGNLSTERLEYKKLKCGGLELDKTTGGLKKKPYVDLIVTKIEIVRNERGVWVKPSIRNICQGNISKNIHVSIGDVIVTFGGIPPRTTRTLGYFVGVPSASSYTVTVDYDHRIAEANEANNRCTRSSTGKCY